MPRTIMLLPVLALVSLLCATELALQAAPPAQESTEQAKPADEKAKQDAEAKAKQEADEKAKKEAEEKAKKEAKEARDRQRKLAKTQRDLDVARLKKSKLQLDHEHGQIKLTESLARAKVDLDLLKQKFKTFNEISTPNRIARAKLNLQLAEDGLKDAKEELAQLEIMYNDQQLADKTKEIVIERAKRRLERTQRDLELREQEHKTLLEITIPLEKTEQELGLQDKERALAQMDRDEASAKIERQIAVIGTEAEIERLEQELADVQEDIKDAAAKKGDSPSK